MVRVKKIPPKLLVIFSILVAIALVEIAVIAWKLENIKTDREDNRSAKDIINQITANEPSFNKAMHSVNDPASLWAVVNKGRILPADYSPSDLKTPNIRLRNSASSPAMKLRSEASSALEQALSAAVNEGINLRLVSGYRSYNTQVSVYGSMVNTYGQARADRESARPGHSEHQTGWAADVGRLDGRCELEACFGETAEGKWLAQNAYKHGFIIRYQEGKENLTGYSYEPWHIRYVGSDLAMEIQKSLQTLEQFFGLSSSPTYTSPAFLLKVGS